MIFIFLKNYSFIIRVCECRRAKVGAGLNIAMACKEKSGHQVSAASLYPLSHLTALVLFSFLIAP